MLSFQSMGRIYSGESALEIVRALESDALDYPHRGRTVREFLRWSLERLDDRLPPRDLDLSDRLEDETLALSYLYLRDEYGAGKLSVSQGDRNAESGQRLANPNGSPGYRRHGLPK
jgi:hypothetical protein